MNGVRNYAGTGAKDFNEDNGLVEKVYNQAENPARKHCGGNYTGIGILAVVVGKPNMVTLIECSSTAQAGEVKDLLDNDGSISYQMSDDGLTFYVDEKDNAAASILLGQNGVPTEGFSIDNVFDGGFSSTEADKTKKYKLYLENYFADQLETLSNVESASVTLDIPNDDGTILAREQDSYAAVILTLNSDMSDEQAQDWHST